MKPFLSKFFGRKEKAIKAMPDTDHSGVPLANSVDVLSIGFPLVPDNYHLPHVGKTLQGNGFWIDLQFAMEGDDFRDFVSAYLFDKEGNLISCEVIDQGRRSESNRPSARKIIQRLKHKIDASHSAEIWVKPFTRSFYGHTFGLVAREIEGSSGEVVIDVVPGLTLMFHSPWDLCNYAS